MAFMVPAAIFFNAKDAREFADGEAGWYGYLTANGYLDRTDYTGPYGTQSEAIEAICELFDVDDQGNDLE